MNKGIMCMDGSPFLAACDVPDLSPSLPIVADELFPIMREYCKVASAVLLTCRSNSLPLEAFQIRTVSSPTD